MSDDDSGQCGRGTERVGADENLCHNCGWDETPAQKNYRKCPECGAPFLNRYEQRLFGHTSDTRPVDTDRGDAR